jgi:hypothetical protein
MGNRNSGRKRKRPGKGAGGVGKAKGTEGRDALGRRWRAERRRIERLKARREPLDEWGHHPVVALFPWLAKKIRKKLKLSLAGAAELAGMRASAVDKFEKNKGSGMNRTLGKLCRGYVWTVDAFARCARKEHERRLRRRRNGGA